MPKRNDPPITRAVVAAFLTEYDWLASSRHKRDRLAYRIVEWLMNEVSLARVEAAGEKAGEWSKRVGK